MKTLDVDLLALHMHTHIAHLYTHIVSLYAHTDVNIVQGMVAHPCNPSTQNPKA